MTAWTRTNDFHLIDSIDELVEELEDKGFGNIDNRLILQVISGMLIGSTKTENILRLTGDKVRDRWDDVKEAMRKVVDFLATEIQCKNIDFLPYHQQLVPLGRMYYKEKNHLLIYWMRLKNSFGLHHSLIVIHQGKLQQKWTLIFQVLMQ